MVRSEVVQVERQKLGCIMTFALVVALVSASALWGLWGALLVLSAGVFQTMVVILYNGRG